MKEHMQGIDNNLVLAEEDQFSLVMDLVEVIHYHRLNERSPLCAFYKNTIPKLPKEYLELLNDHRISAMIILAAHDMPQEKQFYNQIMDELNITPPAEFSSQYVIFATAAILQALQNKNKNVTAIVTEILKTKLTKNFSLIDGDRLALIALLAFYGHNDSRQIYAQMLYHLINNHREQLAHELFNLARQQAIQLYPAFMNDNAYAIYQFARMHDPFLLGTDNKYNEACELYSTAYALMDHNNLKYGELCFNYAIALWHNRDNNTDIATKQILDLLNKSIHHGCAEAMHALGEFYYQGKITGSQEIETALPYYEAAAKHNMFNAHVRLAELYPAEKSYQQTPQEIYENYQKGFEHYQIALAIMNDKNLPNAFNQMTVEAYDKFAAFKANLTKGGPS